MIYKKLIIFNNLSQRDNNSFNFVWIVYKLEKYFTLESNDWFLEKNKQTNYLPIKIWNNFNLFCLWD